MCSLVAGGSGLSSSHSKFLRNKAHQYFTCERVSGKRSTKHCRNACSPSFCFVEMIDLDQWLLIMITGMQPPAFYLQRHSSLTSWYDRTIERILNPNLTSVTHEKVLSKKSLRSCCLVSVQYSLSFKLWFCLQQPFEGILLAASLCLQCSLTLSVLLEAGFRAFSQQLPGAYERLVVGWKTKTMSQKMLKQTKELQKSNINSMLVHHYILSDMRFISTIY